MLTFLLFAGIIPLGIFFNRKDMCLERSTDSASGRVCDIRGQRTCACNHEHTPNPHLLQLPRRNPEASAARQLRSSDGARKRTVRSRGVRRAGNSARDEQGSHATLSAHPDA